MIRMSSKSAPSFFASFFRKWTWVMAWRESRSHRLRLLLYMSAIAMGITALVAVSSFSLNLEKALLTESKSLMGSDLTIFSRQPFDPDTESFFKEIGGTQASVTEFSSMAFMPGSGHVRLSRIVGIEGGYPFYGRIDTDPEHMLSSIKSGRKSALVDITMMNQYDIQIGDMLNIGNTQFKVVGALKKMPGQSAMGSIFAPTIVINGLDIEDTGLIRPGSVVFYSRVFKLSKDTDLTALSDRIKPFLNKKNLTGRTINQFEERLVRQLDNVKGFLKLAAFISLILGSIGVASSIHVYIRRKITTVAILRCLGSHIHTIFPVYLVQAGMIGCIGSVLGIFGGLALQTIIPDILKDFMVSDIDITFYGLPVVLGLVMGLGMTLLFSSLPLLIVRKVSPLMALRSSVNTLDKEMKRDSIRWLIYCMIITGITLFAVLNAGKWWHGIIFSLTVFIAFSVLYLIALLIMKGLRSWFPQTVSYIYRQALANLFRPNNQTVILILALGLGTFLFTTLLIVQNSLLVQVSDASGQNRPNLIFYDIQTDQIEDVVSIVKEKQFPILENVPIITMRLKSVNGESIETLRNKKDKKIPRWVLLREYRSTYRNILNNTEEVVAGTWHGELTEIPDIPLVSLEKDLAERLGVTIGDKMEIDIQGIPFTITVGSIRKVDWRQFRTNFFMIFPSGIIDDAPQIHVLATRADSPDQSAELQRTMIRTFPGISAIDLQLLFTTIDTVLSKISFVIQFMSLFCIFTGFLVLIAALSTTRFQRIQESILLRVIGGSRKQINRIMIAEYIILGSLGSGTGALLSVLGGYGIIHFVFKSPFAMPLLPVALVVISVVVITTILGLINSRGILNHPPLALIRSENM